MDEPVAMGVIECRADLGGDAHGSRDIKGPALFESIVEVAAGDVLHGNVVVPRLLIRVVDVNDVGMIQCGSGQSFLLEATSELTILGQEGGHDFDGDMAVERGLVGFVDGGHPTPPDFFQDAVFAQRLANQVAFHVHLFLVSGPDLKYHLRAADGDPEFRVLMSIRHIQVRWYYG